MKKRKLLALLGICSILVVGTVVTFAVSTKKDVKASEVIDDEDDEDEEEMDRCLSDYFKRVKLNQCVIELEADSFDWSGQVITPKVVVKYNGLPLTINKDYKLKYSDNIDAGVGIVKVKGIGDYRGTRKFTFTIKGIDIAKDCTFEFVDNKIVMYHNGELVSEKDYDVDSYYYDTFIRDDGKYTTYVRTTTYVIFGKGQYEGEYEFPTERTYRVNNETGEKIFE